MTIISARSLSTADLRHLGANLAAAVERDRHNVHAPHIARSRPTEVGRVMAGQSPLIPTKKEPVRC